MTAALLLFERLPGADLEVSLERLRRLPQRSRLLCRRCGNPITTPAQRITVAGAHQHRFHNPAGQAFHIGCFRDADGCTRSDASWRQYSWFPGYRWSIALCARCDNHLGWYFHGQQGFFGLILDQLRPAG